MAAGVFVPKTAVAAQQLDQISHWDTENRAGETFFEAGDQ
ncbi:Uncharacterised protein [Mycobacterium tuberculosis]|nr:Uncharacterised protein [Mycobacterium tuberculosis]COW94890.1 Uncharacterised protein [Mycobacterium tuberculosis]